MTFFLVSLLDDMDPLSTKSKPQTKTPQAFLGENSALVNLDYLIKPNNPSGNNSNIAYNPFSDSTGSTAIPQRTNLFQQNQPVSFFQYSNLFLRLFFFKRKFYTLIDKYFFINL